MTISAETHRQASSKKTMSRESAPRNTHSAVFDLLRERLREGRVLDIPCGSGAFIKRAAEGRYTLIAADIADHPAIPDVEFHQANMNESLPFDEASFDAVVSIEGIEHLRRPFDFVKECARIVKPGGWLFITTPNISSLRSRWRWFLTGFHHKGKYPLDEGDPQPRHHINMLSFPQLRYMLHTQGFAVESITTNRIKPINWAYAPLVPFHYCVMKAVFKRGAKTERLAAQNRALLKEMMSLPILFGESMIVAARRVGPS